MGLHVLLSCRLDIRRYMSDRDLRSLHTNRLGRPPTSRRFHITAGVKCFTDSKVILKIKLNASEQSFQFIYYIHLSSISLILETMKKNAIKILSSCFSIHFARVFNNHILSSNEFVRLLTLNAISH